MLANREIAVPGTRYQVVAVGGAPVTRDLAPESTVLHTLAADRIVVCAEARVADNGDRRVRISSPAGWMDARDLELAPPLPSHGLDFETFRERHRHVAPGDYYGLEFPFTMEMFLEFGSAFLTQAFRAAGTIASDNAVTEIVALKSLGKMGASENAFLTVAYAKAEPGLSEKLFAKFPPLEEQHKFGLSHMAHGEIAMHQFSRRAALPVQMAKYYYGEYSSHTTNYLLITERIPFGESPVEPAHLKGWDHLLPELEDHYAVLARAQAKLAAAHKTGVLGDDLEEVFPFARSARYFRPIDDPGKQVDKLIDFVARIAPQIFIAEGRDPAFLARWREDLLYGLAHKDDVTAYLHADVDYVSFCHPNLNPDNAWFWRDPAGELHAGLLDWGGAGQMSIAQALSGMLMMVDPERHLQIVRMVLDAFAEGYAAQGGPMLDRDELYLQYKASLFSTALGTIVGMVVDLLPAFSEDDYRAMEDRFDSRLLESGLYAAIVWIDDMLREWHDDLTPGEACRIIVERMSGGNYGHLQKGE